MSKEQYVKRLFSISGEKDFESLSLEIFRLQSEKNNVYSEYIKNLGIKPASIQSIEKIPFLPVEFFKSHTVIAGDEKYESVFTSSGTTDDNVSRHYIKDISFYEKVFTKIFADFYGDPSQYTILALLPSYLERQGSSLVYMMEKLIGRADPEFSGFYLHDVDKLHATLEKLHEQKRKTFLFGVTFALLDFVSAYRMNFPELIVMETGGMKGRRREMIREEVHEELCRGFGVEKIHSEYGMTELLSQGYSSGYGIFRTPPWMRILIRDTYDPLLLAGTNTNGGINIIDLANIDSCSFIATQDLGKVYEDHSFEVLGRFDFSDVRGCNLMVV
jgi:hypothetical protein